MCDVADGLRCSKLLNRLSGQADAESHADADDCSGKPCLPRQTQRRDCGLFERVRLAGKGAGDLRSGQGWQESGEGKSEARRGTSQVSGGCYGILREQVRQPYGHRSTHNRRYGKTANG